MISGEVTAGLMLAPGPACYSLNPRELFPQIETALGGDLDAVMPRIAPANCLPQVKGQVKPLAAIETTVRFHAHNKHKKVT